MSLSPKICEKCLETSALKTYDILRVVCTYRYKMDRAAANTHSSLQGLLLGIHSLK